MGINADYVTKMKAQLKKWDADVDALSARGASASDEARTLYVDQVRTLRASRDAAQKSFQQMRAAGESAGTHLKEGMEQAWKAMQKSLERASSSFPK